jgi:hypothetical protein
LANEILEVDVTAVTGVLAGDVRGEHLAVDFQLAARRQVVAVYTLCKRFARGIVDRGGKKSERAIRAVVAVLVQQPRNAVVVAGLFPAFVGAPWQLTMEHDVILGRGE